MAEPLRIALAGLRTVGAGLVRLIETNGSLIERRAGRAVQIVAVSARDRFKDRGVDLTPYAWEDDMTALAGRKDVDVVVELVGGADGPALTTARSALKGGKALVTANKAMIAHHGLELGGRSPNAAVVAAQVRGRWSRAGSRWSRACAKVPPPTALERIYGILNGTCNYILSTMESDSGRDFGEVLSRGAGRSATPTEAAAIAASKLIGRGDEKAADQAAVDAMRKAFDALAIDGTVVIGEGERDEAPMLYIGEKVGTGGTAQD